MYSQSRCECALCASISFGVAESGRRLLSSYPRIVNFMILQTNTTNVFVDTVQVRTQSFVTRHYVQIVAAV